jgi:hypothetical protein
VKITTPTTVTGNDASVLWDMGFERRRLIVTETLTFERVRLQGIASDVVPYMFFFMFHNKADFVCNECIVEHSCSGTDADFFLQSMRLVRHPRSAALWGREQSRRMCNRPVLTQPSHCRRSWPRARSPQRQIE